MAKVLIFLFTTYTTLMWANVETSSHRAYSNKESQYQATKEIQSKIVDQVARDAIKQLIGLDQYEKRRSRINQIIKYQYQKFIPYVTAGKLTKNEDTWSGEFQIQLNRSSLRELLLEEGVLYDQQERGFLLPMISILNRYETKTFKWWFQGASTDDFLVLLNKKLHHGLKDALWSHSFYLFDPLRFESFRFLPAKYKQESFTSSGLRNFGGEMGAQIVLSGSLRFGPSKINTESTDLDLNLQASLVGSDKIVAEVSRSWSTESGPYQDAVSKSISIPFKEVSDELSQQIEDAWKKGKFGTSSVKLVLMGRLGYKDWKQVKEKIRTSSFLIKSLMERRLEMGSYTIDLELSGSLDQLVRDMQKLEWTEYQANIKKLDDSSLVLQLMEKSEIQ